MLVYITNPKYTLITLNQISEINAFTIGMRVFDQACFMFIAFRFAVFGIICPKNSV